jgi:hypothetical protein
MDIHGYVDMDVDLEVGGLNITKSRGLDIHNGALEVTVLEIQSD